MKLPEIMAFSDKDEGKKAAFEQRLQSWRLDAEATLSRWQLDDRLQQEVALLSELTQSHLDTYSMAYSHAADQLHQLDESENCYEALQLIWLHEKPIHLKRRQIEQRWIADLKTRVTEAQWMQLAPDYQALMQELMQRAENLDTLSDVMPASPQEGQMISPLWDLTRTPLTQQRLDDIKQVVRRLDKQPQLKAMADQLGRMAQQTTETSVVEQSDSEAMMQDQWVKNIPDAMVGLHYYNDIARIVPNELIYLAQPELEVLFYKGIIEQGLLNYQFAGQLEKRKSVTRGLPKRSEMALEKGPFIVCLDASGSMMGAPEKCAKALCFRLMQIALEQGRDCFVLLFSTDVICFELSGDVGLEQALQFLSFTFHGGTDFLPVLEQGMSLMETASYENADMVVISDFITPRQPNLLRERIAAMKERGNRFHSVVLSSHANDDVTRIFDHHWHYQPSRFTR
ncbi:Protein ViaA [Vibrio stylophorae]|uniref:Protein ViaA n=2 Tax=Vibrio stylophorae TaxID=659351 RepID=A0ABM8ZY21_9VIBR|nr:Protein ViaA [Vibrio stylophorae]